MSSQNTNAAGPAHTDRHDLPPATAPRRARSAGR